MDCQFHEHLVGYLDGELPEALSAQVEEHLGGCPACARELEELRLTGSLLERWAAPKPSAQARSRAWAALTSPAVSEPKPVKERPRWLTPLIRYALPLAAGILVAVVLVAPWERGRPSAPDELIAELPVLENLEMLEALDVLTEWENLQVLAALEPTLVPANGEEVTP